MLRRDTTPTWSVEHGILGIGTTYVFEVGKRQARGFSKSQYQDIMQRQSSEPAPVMYSAEISRTWWMFEGKYYWEDDGLNAEEVRALILANQRRRQRQIETAMALAREEDTPGATSRMRIPDDIKHAVWIRDGGRCVKCGSASSFEFDHVIPVSKGGSDTERNVQILCQRRTHRALRNGMCYNPIIECRPSPIRLLPTLTHMEVHHGSKVCLGCCPHRWPHRGRLLQPRAK